jgi:hypothetical protein
MCRKMQVERFKVAERALRPHEPQLHQRTGRIVDKDEQGASGATVKQGSANVAVGVTDCACDRQKDLSGRLGQIFGCCL